MKTILFLAAATLFVGSQSFANSNYECGSELSISISGSKVKSFATPVENGKTPAPRSVYADESSEYSFLVDASNDTNTYFFLLIKDEKIIRKEIWIGGNDSDNYAPSLVVGSKFSCVSK